MSSPTLAAVAAALPPRGRDSRLGAALRRSFEPAAWFRGICAGEVPVGFAMLHDPTRASAPDEPETCFLWRFMIDARHQGRGYGAAAMRLLIEHVRTLAGVRTFALSYVPGDGSPRDFYSRFGFRDTGEVDDGELVMKLPLG